MALTLDPTTQGNAEWSHIWIYHAKPFFIKFTQYYSGYSFVFFHAEDDVKKGVVPLCLTPEVLLILNHGFEHLTDTRITDQKLFKDLNYLQNALNSTKYLRVRFKATLSPHFEPILFCWTNKKYCWMKISKRLVFNTELEQLLRSHLHGSPFRAPIHYSCEYME